MPYPALSDDGATTCTGATREPGLEGVGELVQPKMGDVVGFLPSLMPQLWQCWGRFTFGFTRRFVEIQMEHDDTMFFFLVFPMGFLGTSAQSAPNQVLNLAHFQNFSFLHEV